MTASYSRWCIIDGHPRVLRLSHDSMSLEQHVLLTGLQRGNRSAMTNSFRGCLCVTNSFTYSFDLEQFHYLSRLLFQLMKSRCFNDLYDFIVMLSDNACCPRFRFPAPTFCKAHCQTASSRIPVHVQVYNLCSKHHP